VSGTHSGYGRSEGSPSPTSLQRDAVCIVKHLRTELGLRSIIAHGESIGVRAPTCAVQCSTVFWRCVYSFIHLFIYSFIHLFIYSPIHLFM
jgi:hypothetical protein